MELTYYGANCLRIATKKAQIVVDDNLASLGLRPVTKPTDISLRTSEAIPVHQSRFEVRLAGEYEISGMVIHGVAAQPYMEEKKRRSATVYTIAADDMKVAIMGHIHPQLDEEQLEQIGMVDIVVVPVGNGGYTLDGIGALKIIKQIEPKAIIPTHYADKAIRYAVSQVELAEALKSLAMEPAETLDRYKPKPADWTDTARLIVLKRQ
ncbi:MBL fold metallo-hydrolase [Candidatus Saccharibacteria bacterium]|nr:MBL fold metallo-hydrolase [Candidatus Saccharibacteria bacterium]